MAEEYEGGWKVNKIFPVNSVAVLTARDHLAVQWTADEMQRVAADFVVREPSEARRVYRLRKDVQDWKVSWAQEDLRKHPDSRAHITPLLYRPFDTRFTYYTGKSRGFICRPRTAVMKHMIAGPNTGLCVGRAGQVVGSHTWDVAFVSRYPSDFNLFRRGGNCLCPLYTYPAAEAEDLFSEHDSSNRRPNLETGLVQTLRDSLGLTFIPEGCGDLDDSFGPEDVLHYVYAVLHSPEYRIRYAEFLKSDFPRVPLTGNLELFAGLVPLGRRLVALHLMEEVGEALPSFPVQGSHRVKKPKYTAPCEDALGQVWINGNQYFEGVSPEAWSFTIGGYRPVEEWLKHRKERTLSFDDIERYRRICGALTETSQIMELIDHEIDLMGGWPIQ